MAPNRQVLIRNFMFLFCQHFLDQDDSNRLIEDDIVQLEVLLGGLKREHAPKIEGFAENVLLFYEEYDFKQDFRINRSTFDIILQRINIDLLPTGFGGKEAVSPAKQLLIFLWFLANPVSYRVIARTFDVSKSTARSIVVSLSSVISNLRFEIIRLPSPNHQRRTSREEAAKTRVPGIVGYIDGTHIRLSRLPNHDQDYINRKGYPSVVLQV